MRNKRNTVGQTRRPGVVVVFTLVMVVVICGFAALTIDVGAMYNMRADLQRAADAAALAAAAGLAEPGSDDPVARARKAAVEYVERNHALGRRVKVDADSDIEFGIANYDAASNSYRFETTDVLPDAVRVRVRCTDDSVNGPMSLYFARIFGRTDTNVSAEAIAVMTPRDIAIAADLSGSINDDSELRNYKLTEINLYDVWAALPQRDVVVGSVDPDDLAGAGTSGGSDPGADLNVSTILDGPAWGYMTALGFGNDLDPTAYDPASDPGLVRLPYNSSWTDAKLTQYLSDRGYSSAEVSAILSSSYDSNGAYKYRTAVALGLAFWNSGMSGGLWQARDVPSSNTGNANVRVEAGELEWVQQIFDMPLSESRDVWLDYIDGYVRSGSTAMVGANSGFRYRYGVKTFVNYLLERRGAHSQTPEIAGTPAQPMQAVKDAATYMADLLTSLETNDLLSLEVYGSTARHEVDLTNDFYRVAQRMSELQAGHYDNYTNMGGGIERAIEELTGPRARRASRKVLVLLTDGIANVDANGRTGNTSDGAAHAIRQAERAAALGIKIFAVSVGAGADQDIMKRIAEIGNGEHFHAEGSIDQYSAGLANIFMRIGSKRTYELIQ